MLKRGLAIVLALSAAVATVTAVQYAAEVDPRALELLPRPRVAVAALGTLLATTGYFGLRWLRWHYLVRRFTRRVRARDSVILYFATLPALLTPFGLGELVRVLALRKRSPLATRHLLLVFALERGFEAGVVAGVALLDRGLPVALAPSAAVGVLGVLLHRYLTRRSEGGSWLGFAPVALGLSLLEWVLVGGAFSLLLAEVTGVPSSRSALAALGLATLEGGLAGLPLGTGVTSTALIEALTRLGYPRGPAIVAAAAYRVGTAWYAVGAGLVCAVLFRREVVALFRDAGPADHFDEIAASYRSLIPEHVQARLLGRKVGAMVAALDAAGVPRGARGLDIGCGQGAYAAALARAGYRMSAVDPSSGQLAAAREALSVAGAEVTLAHAGAGALPFPDGQFDFVYLINVLHHVPGADRDRALAEALRVLRPGGRLFLHEINTENPLFRFYMGYVFPLLRKIDDGTEEWILPGALPAVTGGAWAPGAVHFTFLPEFLPQGIFRAFAGLERWLERSRLRRYSAHFMATLVKSSDGARE